MATTAARTKRRARRPDPLMADRLLALFGFELAVIERSVEPLKAEDGEIRDVATGAKGRIEALGQMVRTLEKLLELKQLEALAAGGTEAPDAEAERLAAELMRRLRVLDRRRRGGVKVVAAADGAEGTAVAEGAAA
ncbi:MULTISPECIES: hypothetical protein [unclassified Aureimonas]|uniref:hypothetical protein n=1 Tax=unclassified Aureimonas TaxID=2615206 RepID=UPI0006F5C340|nr:MULTISPECIES: hypothetical protein [unclassified Aureimonas]KQT55262.1 hypothetical protein ASG62_10540 [Aureimonas sp. Leaf427]KQT71053.1 hypothetical protein ASG54_20925 [Aureimonas sp. Leaf460]